MLRKTDGGAESFPLSVCMGADGTRGLSGIKLTEDGQLTILPDVNVVRL